MRTLIVGAAIFAAAMGSALAKPSSDVTQFCGDRVCASGSTLAAPIHIRQDRRHRFKHTRIAKRQAAKHRSARRGHHHRHFAVRGGGRGGCRSGYGALNCVTPVLGAKAREIVNACGSVVVSAIAGRPNRSNHPAGKAVDLAGNPGCIYSHLKGWPGGYSTDYGSARHVHISYNPGGQEWGVRFVHRGGRSNTRYARRHHRAPVYATATPVAW